MRQEIKRQKAQHIVDLIIAKGYPSPWSQSETAALWPESQYGGDGPWNNYGEDDEVAPPISVDVPLAPDVTCDVSPHDFF